MQHDQYCTSVKRQFTGELLELFSSWQAKKLQDEKLQTSLRKHKKHINNTGTTNYMHKKQLAKAQFGRRRPP
jgi:hypothetical protein